MSVLHGGERFLSLHNKLCKKNKDDWTSVEKVLKFFTPEKWCL